jgi:hypothetical protein
MEQQVGEGNAFPEVSKRSYRKFVIWFLIIVGLTVGGFFIWDGYFSPGAEYRRQTQENYQKYLDFEANYEKALTEDTFGGKTPEETLDMFIEALEDGNVELASEYFYLDTNEKSEYYLTQNEWRKGLIKAKEEERLGEIINQLTKAIPTKNQSIVNKNIFWYSIYNKNGEVEQDIEFKLNPYSGVWKIESM